MGIRLCMCSLSEQQQHRVELAAGVLAACGAEVNVREWDGGRCDALIVDLEREGGLAAAHDALDAKVEVYGLAVSALAFDARLHVLPATLDAVQLAHHLRHLLGCITAYMIDVTTGRSALERLACDAPWHVGDVMLSHGPHRLLLMRSTGRLLANSSRAMVLAAAQLGCSDWSLGSPAGAPRMPFSQSLDGILVSAACSGAANLPLFPAGRWRLARWPDLGKAPHAVIALIAAAEMQGDGQRVENLHLRLGLDAMKISQALWAFCASGLLVRGDASDLGRERLRSALHRIPDKRFAVLARHFGLSPEG